MPKKKEWGPKDALAWRQRMQWTQKQATEVLHLVNASGASKTVASWEQGTRALPPPMALLMQYVERYGPIDD